MQRHLLWSPAPPGASLCFSRAVAIPIWFGVTGRGLRPCEDAGVQIASPSLPPFCILIFCLKMITVSGEGNRARDAEGAEGRRSHPRLALQPLPATSAHSSLASHLCFWENSKILWTGMKVTIPRVSTILSCPPPTRTLYKSE